MRSLSWRDSQVSYLLGGFQTQRAGEGLSGRQGADSLRIGATAQRSLSHLVPGPAAHGQDRDERRRGRGINESPDLRWAEACAGLGSRDTPVPRDLVALPVNTATRPRPPLPVSPGRPSCSQSCQGICGHSLPQGTGPRTPSGAEPPAQASRGQLVGPLGWIRRGQGQRAAGQGFGGATPPCPIR